MIYNCWKLSKSVIGHLKQRPNTKHAIVLGLFVGLRTFIKTFTLTSCKMLRNCSNCCLQYCTSCIIEFRRVLSSMNNCSSGEPLAESRPNCDAVFVCSRCKFSIERGLSEPFKLVWCKRDRFKSRVDRAGSCELFENYEKQKFKKIQINNRKSGECRICSMFRPNWATRWYLNTN